MTSLSALKHRFFVSADVCGFIKVWTSTMKPLKVKEFQLEGAVSYNSMIEVEGYLPKKEVYRDSAIIACALKSQKVHLILITPESQTGSSANSF